VTTSNYRNVGVWMNTADCLQQPNATERDHLSWSAKWNVAELAVAALASSFFFLVPLVTPARSDMPALPHAEHRQPRSLDRAATAVPAAVQSSFTKPSIGASSRKPRQVARVGATALTQSVGPTRPAQSKIARLFLGDGSAQVQPFPRLRDR
jgi:hypothetical protein